MLKCTITVRGPTTVAAQVREKLGVAAGTRLVWNVMPDGSVLVRAKTKSILDMAGLRAACQGQAGGCRRDERLALMAALDTAQPC
jgi:bifunctional DNA-binding transcriptional regulator/antitoxin component of YhaV-PrlF toxin-antitoxin module